MQALVRHWDGMQSKHCKRTLEGEMRESSKTNHKAEDIMKVTGLRSHLLGQMHISASKNATVTMASSQEFHGKSTGTPQNA